MSQTPSSPDPKTATQLDPLDASRMRELALQDKLIEAEIARRTEQAERLKVELERDAFRKRASVRAMREAAGQVVAKYGLASIEECNIETRAITRAARVLELAPPAPTPAAAPVPVDGTEEAGA